MSLWFHKDNPWTGRSSPATFCCSGKSTNRARKGSEMMPGVTGTGLSGSRPVTQPCHCIPKYRAQSIRSGFDMSKVLTYDNSTHFCMMSRTVIMPGPLHKYAITLTAAQAMHLQHLSTCYTTPYAEVQRARILLLAHQHPTWRNAEIARRVDCCVNTVKRWRQRRQT